ncbi:MAG: N-glycosylase/DNA lyase [Candidatus Lokiarchaeota archaeon]|nr:N-glycosylase/DNA lyase [Candidatus Lokiarchaeota archaeon]
MSLLKTIEDLKKKSQIKSTIKEKISEFESFKNKKINEIFKELCFCIMTANCAAEKCIQIHGEIGNDFLTLNEIQLIKKFKELGYRFPNVRAKYILKAREKISDLQRVLNNYNNHDLRIWISESILGLGFKEASHFLRNIGYKEYAIIDFHIVDILKKYNLIEKPKTMSKKKYLEIEYILKEIANKLDLNLAELDLYLWYLETGKILR